MAGEAMSNSYELGLVTRKGERREYETSVAIVPNTDPMRIVTIGKDITERKLADAERRRLAEVLEETVDFVGWADMEGRLHYHNRAARQMIGLPEESDLSSMQISDMHPEWALKMIEEVAMPIVLERGMWRGESVLLHRDGREIQVSQMIMLHRDANGRPAYTSTIMQDISERKATEFVRETALKEANRLAQMRGAFMSQMSHELRTPLNSILGCAQLLQMDESLDEEQTLWTNTIRSSGEYLLLLVNDILDYAKFEADKMEIHAEETELDTLLATIIGIVRINTEQKGLAFNFEPDSDLPSIIRCDGLRLRQVLLNLLSNAVKFTDQGHVDLRIRFLPPGLLRFEVEDSGIGISEDDIENIFQPYTQVGDARRHAAGTGLGLAISRQLVLLMGGEIKVESRPGHGSIFFINLPVEIVQAAPMELSSLQTETSPKTRVEPSLPITVPPSDMLEALYSLALRGNMRAIITFTRHLTEIDDSYFDFADHVRSMAKAYESKDIVDFVAKYLEVGAGHE
jgi:PAS domain S-box-containing protein